MAHGQRAAQREKSIYSGMIFRSSKTAHFFTRLEHKRARQAAKREIRRLLRSSDWFKDLGQDEENTFA